MEIKLGSHVKVAASNNYLVGALEDTLRFGGNAMMVYTGAPQNTIRVPLERMKIKEFKKGLEDNNIPGENVIVHAPYIINLGSTVEKTRELAINFLKKELIRSQAFGAKYIVLHPGNHLKESVETGINQIIEGLNEIFKDDETDMIIALETMAGKGTEIGRSFEELAQIINKCKYPERLGVCLDTCHINDAGYDLNNLGSILNKFDETIGLHKLSVIHLNDSKNVLGAKKDRHENIGYGTIGFENLLNVLYNGRTQHVVKILETPYIDGIPPYKQEILMLKSKKWTDFKKEF